MKNISEIRVSQQHESDRTESIVCLSAEFWQPQGRRQNEWPRLPLRHHSKSGQRAGREMSSFFISSWHLSLGQVLTDNHSSSSRKKKQKKRNSTMSKKSYFVWEFGRYFWIKYIVCLPLLGRTVVCWGMSRVTVSNYLFFWFLKWEHVIRAHQGRDL